MPYDPDLAAAIAGDSPAGEDLEYDVVLDRISEARKKAVQAMEPDKAAQAWSEVASLCRKTLGTRSKDLRVSVWLTEAWLHIEGMDGLRNGLELTERLVADYWDHVYPLPDEGDLAIRAAPLVRLDLETGRQLLSIPLLPTEASFHQVLQARRALGFSQKELDEFKEAKNKTLEDLNKSFGSAAPGEFRETLEKVSGLLATAERLAADWKTRFRELDRDSQPSLFQLRDGLRSIRDFAISQIPEYESVQEPDAASPNGESELHSRPPPSAPISTPADAAAAVIAAARVLREVDLSDPTPYLLVRALRWGEVLRGDLDVDPGILPAPSASDRSHLRALLLEGDYRALVSRCESLAAQPQGRGWLDLQRYSVTGLRNLGPDYESAAGAIRRLLSAFLSSRPNLIVAALADGSPAADLDTLAWLRAEGIHDTAPRFREILDRIESSALEDWAVVLGNLAEPVSSGTPKSVHSVPAVGSGTPLRDEPSENGDPATVGPGEEGAEDIDG